MLLQPLHPLQFIVEFLGADRIAVWQIDRRDDQAAGLGFDVAAMRIVGIARKAHATERRRVPFGEDRNAVETLLPVPDRAISGGLDVADRQRFIGALQLLETNDIWLLTRQPFEQARHARADAVDVERGELQTEKLEPQPHPEAA